MNILFYDVETANSNTGTICAVGWVLTKDGSRMDQGYTLIDPGCGFSTRCVEVHGITKAMVKGAPSFAEYWNATLAPMFKSALVVAQNAKFDMAHTIQALCNAGIPDPGVDFLDSLLVFRKYIDAGSHRLPDLAAGIGYEYRAHNALEDAGAILAVLDHIRAERGYSDITELLIRAAALRSQEEIEPVQPVKKPVAEVIDGKLADLKICITGDIPGYEREAVEALIAAHGGRATSSVSGKTDYLVVGVYLESGPGYISGKQKKAMEVIAEGGKVKIITPEEFFKMLD